MRIAMIGTRGIPAGTGGAERVVESLTGELVARGHDVLVYSRKAYVAGQGAPRAGTQVLTGGLNGKHTDALTHSLTAMLNVRKQHVDVIHVHSPGPAIWNWIPTLRGCPTILTVHAPDWRRDKWSTVAKWALWAGLWMGMKTSGAVTAVSQPLAEDLSERFGRSVTYVPNAPPQIDATDPSEVEAMGLSAEGYGLFVGRVVPEKRLDLLIGAWRDSGVDAPLVIVGDLGTGRYGRHCRALAEAGNVRVLGPLYGRALAAVYGHAALVVQPSVLEGMSLVLLEAAAYRRCIVATDLPENRSVLDDAGLYFTADNRAQLAEVIGRCMKQPELRSSKASEGRRRVTERYTWSAAAAQMEALYAEVVARTR